MKYLMLTALSFFCFLTINAQDTAKAQTQKDTYLKWFINYRVLSTDMDKDGEISSEEHSLQVVPHSIVGFSLSGDLFGTRIIQQCTKWFEMGVIGFRFGLIFATSRCAFS